MKALPLACLALALCACKPAPKVSGKPVSYWIAQLDDLDPKTQLRAIEKLKMLDAKDLEPARERLRELREKGPNSGAAKEALYTLRDFKD